MCNDFTPTLLNALRIHNSITGEKGAANGALEKMAIGRLLVSVSTPEIGSSLLGVVVDPGILLVLMITTNLEI